MAFLLKSRETRTFLLIWAGQLISALGSNLTSFAMGVYLYQQTDSVTLFALNLFAYTLPQIALAPFAGVLVDRIDRRHAMFLSDAGSGLVTLAVVALYLTGRLTVAPILVSTFLISAFSTVQWPAWSSTIASLVPTEQLARANGMAQTGQALGQLIAPVVAGSLFAVIGLGGIIAIDFATFLIAGMTLLGARVPGFQLPMRATITGAQPSVWREAAFGFRYIAVRKPLLALLIYFALVNFLGGMILPLFGPLILSIADAPTYGVINTLLGAGMLAGTVFISVWGGPRRRIGGMIALYVLSGAFITLVGLRGWLPLIAIGGFGSAFVYPVYGAINQAFWQSKVETHVQGRVFAVQSAVMWSTELPALLVAGPLVDRVFDPLMALDGPLAGTALGNLLTLGAGRGAGLVFLISGALITVLSIGAWLNPAIRRAESMLPDSEPPIMIPTPTRLEVA